jgi:hypothetical protein
VCGGRECRTHYFDAPPRLLFRAFPNEVEVAFEDASGQHSVVTDIRPAIRFRADIAKLPKPLPYRQRHDCAIANLNVSDAILPD